MSRSKHKVEIQKTKSYEYKAMVDVLDIPDQVLAKLNLDADTEQVQVEGEFSVEWDDDIALVRVESFYITENNLNVEVNLESVETYELEVAIEQSGDAGDWYADRQGNLIDYAYDNYRDEH